MKKRLIKKLNKKLVKIGFYGLEYSHRDSSINGRVDAVYNGVTYSLVDSKAKLGFRFYKLASHIAG